MWKEKLLILLQNNKLGALFASIGLLLILAGIASMILTENQKQGVIIEEAASSDKSSQSKIVVDVSGAVVKPGVYSLSQEARIQEALIAAGGLGADADRGFISKNINLAAKLSNGAKIYIPKLGESRTTGSTSSFGQVAGSSTGLININSASSSELDRLPGIGPVTAQKIIDNRPYANVDDLLAKKVVTSKVFGEIKDKITGY